MASKKITKKAAKKVVRRGGRGRKKYGAASSFVRSVDPTLGAKEVVLLAAKKGIKVSLQLVYNVRAHMRDKKKTAKIARSGAYGRGPKTPAAAFGGPNTKLGFQIRALVDNFVAEIQAAIVANLTDLMTSLVS